MDVAHQRSTSLCRYGSPRPQAWPCTTSIIAGAKRSAVASGTDVAKDAADVILLEKDLHVLADGVAEGRRIFADTLKYVLTGTSSSVGNMASAAGVTFAPSCVRGLAGRW